MNSHVWIVPKEHVEGFGDFGVAQSYIVPNHTLTDVTSSDITGFIWVLLRGSEDRLLLMLYINDVQQINDGLYKSDYIISVDPTRSFKIGKTFQDLARYTTIGFEHYSVGIRKLVPDQVNALLHVLNRNVVIRLTTPSKKLLSRIKVECTDRSHESLLREVMIACVSSFNVDSIWCNGAAEKYKYAPFASVAIAFMQVYYPSIDVQAFDDKLLLLDPYLYAIQYSNTIQSTNSDSQPQNSGSNVDLFLTKIVPEHIVARTFDTRQIEINDLSAAIRKTEFAEVKHQRILADISRYLITIGISPLQSRSVDLAFIVSDALILVEIKTCDFKNVVTQASKGAFQLAYYKRAFLADYSKVEMILVLEDFGSNEVNASIEETLRLLGINTSYYRGSLEWPERLTGLITTIDRQHTSD
jgi:hypothetical protein